MELRVVAGAIEHLEITCEKRNILFEGHGFQQIASGGAIAMALAGLSGAAAQTCSNAGDAYDDVEFYRVRIAGQIYSGICRKFTVKVGDHVEMVIHGDWQALAVRRPATRSIWTFPYMSKGHRAGTIYGIKCYIAASLVYAPFGFLTALLAMLLDQRPAYIYWAVIIPALSLAGFVGLPFVAIFLGPRLFRFTTCATKVFQAFGFERPEWIDLAKSSKLHIKEYNIPESRFRHFEQWY